MEIEVFNRVTGEAFLRPNFTLRKLDMREELKEAFY